MGISMYITIPNFLQVLGLQHLYNSLLFLVIIFIASSLMLSLRNSFSHSWKFYWCCRHAIVCDSLTDYYIHWCTEARQNLTSTIMKEGISGLQASTKRQCRLVILHGNKQLVSWLTLFRSFSFIWFDFAAVIFEAIFFVLIILSISLIK